MESPEVSSKIGRLRSRWCRFSLQSMLLLMLSLSLALGWWQDHRRLKQQIYDLEHPSRGWDTDQVLGPPNTQGSGDIPTAWASTTPDGQQEWLILEYPRAVLPAAVIIHETYNPGAVWKVTAFTPRGEEVELWKGTDPTPPTAPRGISTIPARANFRTSRIKVYIDSPRFPGWNEIDAVGLRDTKGSTQWAVRAYSSSSYGRNNDSPASNVLDLLR